MRKHDPRKHALHTTIWLTVRDELEAPLMRSAHRKVHHATLASARHNLQWPLSNVLNNVRNNIRTRIRNVIHA